MECTICFENPKQEKKLQCGHAFCPECIKRWKQCSDSCPMCRRPIARKYWRNVCAIKKDNHSFLKHLQFLIKYNDDGRALYNLYKKIIKCEEAINTMNATGKYYFLRLS